jgi:uncharacterized protein (TIGR01777 family)
MKIAIPGGSGQIGTHVARTLFGEGHEVVIFSRSPASQPWRTELWNGEEINLEGYDVVLNLAGRSVNCRYHEANRREIMESRVKSTQAVGQAIQRAKNPPRLWLQSSTATIYRHTFDAPNDDVTGELGGREPDVPETWHFSIGVAKAWERAFNEAETPHTRKVALRSAMVMTPDRGGVFDALYQLARLGLGGTMGSGWQYVSWIHGEDFVSALKFLIAHEELSGPVVLASPNPLPNRAFMRALREAVRTPFGLRTFNWMLEIGTFLRGTETELVLKSRRVVPTRLLQAGFQFQHPDWPGAAKDLVGRARQ